MADLFEFETKISGTLDGKKRIITMGEKLAAPKVNLTPGIAAPEVRMLERCLAKLGYMKAGDINGSWDYTTESAMRAFQAAWGLTADAKYGPNSRTALEKALAGQKPPAPSGNTNTNTNTNTTPAQQESGGDPEELPPPLDYAGGNDAHGYKDVAGKIEWAHAKPANTQFWKNVKEADLHHWVTKTDDQSHCADLPAGDIYGPMVSFKVAFVGTGKQCGGLLNITLSNGATIGLLHFSIFNVALKHAQASGVALPAGTYLGSTAKKIGLTSGPHLHTQGHKDGKRVDRKTWLKWMHGEDGVKGFAVVAEPNDAPDDVGFITKTEEAEGDTESFAGTIKGPAGPMKSWPFKLKRDGAPVDQAGLGGATSNKFQGGVWLSGANGEFKFENLPPADYEIEVLLPVGKLVAAETTLPPGLDSGHRSSTPDPGLKNHLNESPEEP